MSYPANGKGVENGLSVQGKVRILSCLTSVHYYAVLACLTSVHYAVVFEALVQVLLPTSFPWLLLSIAPIARAGNNTSSIDTQHLIVYILNSEWKPLAPL